jgi:hypothetical protein
MHGYCNPYGASGAWKANLVTDVSNVVDPNTFY